MIIFPRSCSSPRAKHSNVERGANWRQCGFTAPCSLTPAAVICEIINEDGTMSRRDELIQFSKQHDTSSDHPRSDWTIESSRNLVKGQCHFTYSIKSPWWFNMTSPTSRRLHCHGEIHLVCKPVPLCVHSFGMCDWWCFGSCNVIGGQQLQMSLALLWLKEAYTYLRQEVSVLAWLNKLKFPCLTRARFGYGWGEFAVSLPTDLRRNQAAHQTQTSGTTAQGCLRITHWSLQPWTLRGTN